jgi:enoyl-CoA hydratase/carnithine racemase
MQVDTVSAKFHSELARVFSGAQEDPESDIVVLTGAGRAFTAGGDVDRMPDAIDSPETFQTIAVEAKGDDCLARAFDMGDLLR